MEDRNAFVDTKDNLVIEREMATYRFVYREMMPGSPPQLVLQYYPEIEMANLLDLYQEIQR